MQLLNNTIEKRFFEVGSQDGKGKDALVICKLFNPTGGGTWYITGLVEYQLISPDKGEKYCTSFPEKEKWLKEGYTVGDIILFGWCNLGNDDYAEWGNVSWRELADFRGQFGMGIERDLHCGEHTLRHFIGD